jgi:glycine dehydrogenase subunit 2
MAKLIFEKSQQGQSAYSIPYDVQEFQQFEPKAEFLREEALALPEVSELDLTRHFSGLAKRNMGIDTHFYPLGSCTMKLNPRVNEWAAALPGFVRTHPLAPDESVQGNLQMIEETVAFLCRLCGMDTGSLNPNAGAQGEFVGIKMIAAYHLNRGEAHRRELLIPDSAHGTNPATAAMAGFKTISIPTDRNGDIDLELLRKACSENTAGLMLTNPNTVGLFSPVITQIAAIVHEAGGLLYYDGANLNPMMGIVRPGDMGFDVMHINLHKTFSTPHGGGGPGSGPVLCKKLLEPFLPFPRVYRDGDVFRINWKEPQSIGQISTFHGNFSIYLRANLYMMLHGVFGLRKIAEASVLNANYLKSKLGKLFTVPYSQPCMHEFVVQADNYLGQGVRALDIAKRLLDYGIHAPTVYFPLIVKECMLIEPTETESLDTLDGFVEAMEAIVKEIQTDPDMVKSAPHTMPATRLDEVAAAKKAILKYSD